VRHLSALPWLLSALVPVAVYSHRLYTDLSDVTYSGWFVHCVAGVATDHDVVVQVELPVVDQQGRLPCACGCSTTTGCTALRRGPGPATGIGPCQWQAGVMMCFAVCMSLSSAVLLEVSIIVGLRRRSVADNGASSRVEGLPRQHWHM
jgi:hypothetical protein